MRAPLRILVTLASLAASLAAQDISLATLANEIGDLRAVAFVPAVSFTARQFSSYDRRSVDPAKTGDDGWFANGDQGQFLRTEQRDGKPEHVMADAEGPGAVTRIWSADPKGVLRVYLDGAEQPAIEEPFDKLLGGSHALARAPLAGVRSKGWNFHVPIPYAKRLKITLSEKQVYYHVNVRTYPAGTPVRSWSPTEMSAAAPALAAAAKRLADCDPPHVPEDQAGWFFTEFSVPPGREVEVFDGGRFAPSNGMITGLRLRLFEAKDRPRAWREVILRCTFDGERCVETPLGDFFGSGPGMPPFASVASGVTKDGEAWSRWIMPSEKTCDLRLLNLGAESLSFALWVKSEALPEGKRPRRFHATWRQQLDFPTHPRQDWTVLAADSGAGVYVGCALSIANPVGHWWGEGDEKMFVDGEKLPSTFGTGTEDFFGYAWCDPTPFQHALHGQPRCDGPGNRGFTALYRWQLADCVPWTKSFRFDLEVWHWRRCTISQSATAYWYADPGVRAESRPLDAAALAIPILRVPEVKRVSGAIEGEAMKVLEKTGAAAPQDLSGFGDGLWSGDTQLWWRGAKTGDRLALELTAPAAGRFRVFAAFTKARDYGIHRISIGGQAAGEPRDFYDPRVVPSGEVDLGAFELREGSNRFEVEAAGANPKAAPGNMFGLDYVRLEAVK